MEIFSILPVLRFLVCLPTSISFLVFCIQIGQLRLEWFETDTLENSCKTIYRLSMFSPSSLTWMSAYHMCMNSSIRLKNFSRSYSWSCFTVWKTPVNKTLAVCESVLVDEWKHFMKKYPNLKQFNKSSWPPKSSWKLLTWQITIRFDSAAYNREIWWSDLF